MQASDFLNPSPAFSPLPFWFWNDRLDDAELLRQLLDMKDKGFDGFVIHPRKGLPPEEPYLSDAYLAHVRFVVEKAAGLGMTVVLYDEGMYPSGSCHGAVVRENPAWASRCLTMRDADAPIAPGEQVIALLSLRMEGDQLAEVREGRTDAPGWRNVALVEGFSGGTIRGLCEGEDDGEPNAPPSADLLNPEAVAAFIRLTHERYYAVLAPYFGTTVRAFFTDEPNIVGRNASPDCRAWTDGFLADYLAEGGRVTDLPALWLDAGPRTAALRRTWRRAVNNRLNRVYYGALSAWCHAHRVALTGHPADSADIGLLTHFDWPGQDVVWRMVGPENGLTGHDAVLAKCASDAARHRTPAAPSMNECFGCCGRDGHQWSLSLDELKWYTDWLLVRGTTVLVPHAFFYSVREGRGEERPPDVGPNNLWWPDMRQLTAYIKRMAQVLSGGPNTAQVAVLCAGDDLPWRLPPILQQLQVEFNYLPVDLLCSPACAIVNGTVRIAAQRYRCVLVEDEALLTPEAEALLRDFSSGGGRVLRGTVEGAEAFRTVHLQPENPMLRVTHIRTDGEEFFLLVNEGESAIVGRLQVPVQGEAWLWDAWRGEVRPVCPSKEGFRLYLPRRESLILRVCPGSTPDKTAAYLLAPTALLPGKAVQTLANQPWRVTMAGETRILTADAQGCLPSWTVDQPSFSGTAVYETEITLAQANGLRIDLGEVGCMAKLHINGVEAGWRPWGPYLFDGSALRSGSNTLRIEVTNTLANRLENLPLPSGLMGPVRLVETDSAFA